MPAAGGGKNTELFFRGTVSVWKDEKIQEMDSGNGHTTLSMYLMTPNFILIVKIINLVSAMFCHYKNA